MASKREKWFRRAGLIIGLAGVIEITVWGLLNYEGEPSWFAVPPLSVYVVPFLAGILVAWKWSLGGGIMLIAIAIFWLILLIAIVFSTPITQLILQLLSYIAEFELPLILPLLITGLLFLLSWKAERSHAQRESG